MKLDRRSLLAGAAVVAAGGGVYYLLAGKPENASKLPGAEVLAAEAAGPIDLAKLMEAPTLGERSLGSADAKVTIVEYASATCPHCAEFDKVTFPVLKKDYIDTGKVRFIFREFPFDDLALAAFMLARCAPEDKYFPLLDVLFEQQEKWVKDNPRDELFKIAQLAGFTNDTFNACLNNEKIAKGIIEIKDRGEKEFGVKATPTFFVNGKVLQGAQPIEDFRKMIDEALSA